MAGEPAGAFRTDGGVIHTPAFDAVVLSGLFQAKVPALLRKERVISPELVGRTQERPKAGALAERWLRQAIPIPLTRTNDRAINISMTKGMDTRMAILDTGLDLASRLGLEAVTIGTLAKATGMSKSGLFAHFQSKENLQIELLRYAGEIFAKDVVVPALCVASGEPRIRALVVNWIKYARSLAGGCIFVTASTDFKDRPGKVRDFLLLQQESWIDCLRRVAQSAVDSGDFRNDIDCDQFAFEIYSLLLGFHLYHTLLDNAETERRQEAALDKLLKSYRHTVAEGTSKRRETGLPT